MFFVWHRNRFISVGLEPVLCHTEKSYISYRNLPRILNKITRLIPVLLFPKVFCIIIHFDILGNMSIIRFDK